MKPTRFTTRWKNTCHHWVRDAPPLVTQIISVFEAKVAVFVMGSQELARKRQNETETTGVGSLTMHVLKSSPDLEGTAFCRRAQGIVTRCTHSLTQIQSYTHTHTYPSTTVVLIRHARQDHIKHSRDGNTQNIRQFGDKSTFACVSVCKCLWVSVSVCVYACVCVHSCH